MKCRWMGCLVVHRFDCFFEYSHKTRGIPQGLVGVLRGRRDCENSPPSQTHKRRTTTTKRRLREQVALNKSLFKIRASFLKFSGIMQHYIRPYMYSNPKRKTSSIEPCKGKHRNEEISSIYFIENPIGQMYNKLNSFRL